MLTFAAVFLCVYVHACMCVWTASSYCKLSSCASEKQPLKCKCVLSRFNCSVFIVYCSTIQLSTLYRICVHNHLSHHHRRIIGSHARLYFLQLITWKGWFCWWVRQQGIIDNLIMSPHMAEMHCASFCLALCWCQMNHCPGVFLHGLLCPKDFLTHTCKCFYVMFLYKVHFSDACLNKCWPF